MFSETGEEMPSYVSFYTMATLSNNLSDITIFDRIYSRLSDEVHFSFRNWEDYWQGKDVIRTSVDGNAAEVASIFLLVIIMLNDGISQSETHTDRVRRDARFLWRRAKQAFGFLMSNLEEPPSDVFFDEDLMLAIGKRLRPRNGT